ncbi:YtnP family quorum-quenching lactonase [Priestia taiwanensis]|uniref:MBL fold metallo-hydrolase n=1 Tax=Priestia taiwanensis TaxID=1347902 RepID=A0A917AWJ9_9BACI|nr:MBL fold metallo-hydrolase [Priestia taiwanensis]MBM7363388.1 glyoxylase-like metal-dependent hydrolase (beta-lactamase superfamily II) [Priestia taiwanensis]GGE77570.1 MBL fold metallo-hydrolase [Priestia taiwanensis]
MEKLNIGEVTVTWLDGGNTALDGGAMFGVVPKLLWTKKYPCNELNQIHMRNDPLLIQTRNRNILIDAGMGKARLNDKQKRNFGVQKEANIDESLQILGLKREDIHCVCMTHLHFDHVSGLTRNENGILISMYPNATIYTSHIEWDEMRNPNIRSRNTYWRENWEHIQEQVCTFTDKLDLDEGIKMIHTGGHSDGHSIILIESNGEKMLHLGDIMPTHAHQNPLWVMAYDDYPMTSIYEKEEWIDYGVKENAWFTFYHDAYYRAVKWNGEGELVDVLKVAK